MADPSDPLTAPRPTAGNGHVPVSGDGGDGGGPEGGPLGRAPRPTGGRPPGPSVKPAAVVFGIIAVLFVAGFVTDDITSAHHTPAPSPAAAPTAPVAGSGGLVPEPVRTVIAPIIGPDQPPANVLDALVVPQGTADVPGTVARQGVGLYDSSISLQVRAPEEHAIVFFRAELAAGNWQVVSAGASGSDYRFVAQHPGSDGYEWEVGITLSPTTFASAVKGQTVPDSGLTPVTLRLFANSDDS